MEGAGPSPTVEGYKAPAPPFKNAVKCLRRGLYISLIYLSPWVVRLRGSSLRGGRQLATDPAVGLAAPPRERHATEISEPLRGAPPSFLSLSPL